MNKIAQKVKQELGELIPVTLFFFVTFQLLVLTQALVLQRYGIRVRSFVNATILAMVIAKVVIISDHFKSVNRFPDRPLVYNVVWKTAIYFVAALLVRYLENLVRFWRKASSFAEANRQLFSEIIWPHFWLLQLWLLILLLVYCTVREIIRAIGRERMILLFFKDARTFRSNVPESPTSRM